MHIAMISKQYYYIVAESNLPEIDSMSIISNMGCIIVKLKPKRVCSNVNNSTIFTPIVIRKPRLY